MAEKIYKEFIKLMDKGSNKSFNPKSAEKIINHLKRLIEDIPIKEFVMVDFGSGSSFFLNRAREILGDKNVYIGVEKDTETYKWSKAHTNPGVSLFNLDFTSKEFENVLELYYNNKKTLIFYTFDAVFPQPVRDVITKLAEKYATILVKNKSIQSGMLEQQHVIKNLGAAKEHYQMAFYLPLGFELVAPDKKRRVNDWDEDVNPIAFPGVPEPRRGNKTYSTLGDLHDIGVRDKSIKPMKSIKSKTLNELAISAPFAKPKRPTNIEDLDEPVVDEPIHHPVSPPPNSPEKSPPKKRKRTGGERCSAISANGERCKNPIKNLGPKCWIHTYNQDKLKIKKQSSIPQAGEGLKAEAPKKKLKTDKIVFKKDEIIGTYDGEVLTKEQSEKSDSAYILGQGNKYWDAKKKTYTPMRYINDCRGSNKEKGECKGNNVKFNSSHKGNPPKVKALKNIKQGEELFASYGASYWSGIEDKVKKNKKKKTK